MRPIKLNQIPAPFFIGIICYTVTLSLVFLGINKTTALDSSLIGSVEPLVVCVLGAIILKEFISKKRIAGIAISLLGTLIIILEPIFQGLINGGQTHTPERVIGNLLIGLYLITNGIYVVATKKYFKRANAVSPMAKIGIGFIAALITLFPLAMLEIAQNPGIISSLNKDALFPILYMAIFSGFVAYLFCEKAIKLMTTSEVVLFTYLQPLFAVPASFLLLGEKPTGAFIIGATIIVVGVLIAESKKNKFNF